MGAMWLPEKGFLAITHQSQTGNFSSPALKSPGLKTTQEHKAAPFVFSSLPGSRGLCPVLDPGPWTLLRELH